MNLNLTEEQRFLKKTLSDFVDRELAPRAAVVDREESFPREGFRQLAGLGLLGLTVSKEHGGAEADLLSAAVVMEEIARGCASTALSWGAHAILCTHNLYVFSNESQRRRYLPSLCRGEKIGAFALTEPNAGSDATSLSTRAARAGKGYRLSGTKMFITNAPVADLFLVFARSGPESLSLFIVEKDFPGVSVGKPLEKLGMRGSPTAEVVLQEVPVPEENRLGEEGEGVEMMLRALDVERAVFSALPVGIAQAALDAAVSYARQRRQFGKPIGEFQLVQEMLARMATELAAARLLAYQAAAAADGGARATCEASYAKLFGAEMVNRVTQDAVQIFGGYGYIREFPVERYLRDARLISLGGGTSEIQKLIIAREILKSSEES
ncbi:MAG TPA: acyl-CoA dehydrogenase family protein [Nitrospiria bacterium]|nr:acyl-CoA dehydrogenase family protein [Nitrospiria bacterium]